MKIWQMGRRGSVIYWLYVGSNAKRKYAILIEVKSSRKQEHKKKAARQLERGVRDVKAFYGDNVRCFCLSVYTSNNYFRNSRWISKPYDINWIRES